MRIRAITAYLAAALVIGTVISGWQGVRIIQAAEKPSFAIAKSNITLAGIGKANKYKLKINHTENYTNCSFIWTSSNPEVVKVAKEQGQGNATDGYYCNLLPKAKGTAKVKCVVNYTTKKNVQKKKTLKVSVAVTVPCDRSTDNHIVNKNISNKTTQEQYIYNGETYAFEGAISPIGSSDNIYWKSTDESVFTVDENGVVTGTGEGAAVLEMYVGANAESAYKLEMLDSLKIRILARPSVKSIQLKNDANTLVINFTHEVAKNTVISGSSLSENISIIPAQYDGVEGKDLGKLNAVLNEKTLIVMTEHEFSGAYEFVISSNVLTTDGMSIEAYDKIKKVVVSLEN